MIERHTFSTDKISFTSVHVIMSNRMSVGISARYRDEDLEDIIELPVKRMLEEVESEVVLHAVKVGLYTSYR